MMIGIIGQGFVGFTIKSVFENYYQIETYDKYLSTKSSSVSIKEICNKCKFIFVCVPTPSNYDGSCNIELLSMILEEIDSFKLNNIIIIKSTIPPNTTNNFSKKYMNIDIVFNPEFLTEKNAINDFKNQDRIILGGNNKLILHKVKEIYEKIFPDALIILTESNVAEMLKYMTNIFLSTKLSFANEIKILCDKLYINYDELVEYFKLDKRIGNTHLNVPGPDGLYGFGGSCFPKDIQSLIVVAKMANVPFFTIEGVWETNLYVRPEKDWLALKGRSIIDSNTNYKFIIVTGGCGFIGSKLIDKLLEIYKNCDNMNIISIDNEYQNLKVNYRNGVQYIKDNTCNIARVLANLPNTPECVFHFGEYSRISSSFEDVDRCFEYNIKGTSEVIKYCQKNNCRLIYSASSSILGKCPNGYEKKQNISPYAFSKSTNVDLIKNYGDWFGLKYNIIYFYNVYGDGEIDIGKYSTVIGVFKNQYSCNKPLSVVKPGTQIRDFTHISDTINGIIATFNNGINTKEYYLGSGESYSILDIAQSFGDNYEFVEERPGERYYSLANNQETMSELNWKPNINVIQHIKEYVNLLNKKHINNI